MNSIKKFFPPTLLFFIAISIRLYFLTQNYALYNSYGKYEWVSEKIINSENIGVRILDFSPLYTYLSIIFHYLFLGNRFFLLLFQNILGSINVILIYFLGKKLFTKEIGILAGIMLALYKNIILYEFVFEPITVVMFFNSLTILSLLFVAESIVKKKEFKKILFAIFVSGVLFGCGVTTRPNILLFLPLICFWFFNFYRKFLNKKFIIIIFYMVLFAGIFATLIPTIARNYFFLKKTIPTVMSPGQVFHQGNYIEAQGLGIAYPPVLSDIYYYEEENGDFMHEMYRKVAEYSIGGDISFEKSSWYWFNKALNFIEKYPFKYLGIIRNKVISFFSPFEMHDIPKVFPMQASIRGIPFITFKIILPFSLLGIFLSLKRGENCVLITSITVVYFLSNVIFFISSRQRLPCAPFLIIFAAYFIIMCYRFIIEKSYKTLFLSVTVLIFFFIIFSYPFEVIKTNRIKTGRLDNVFFPILFKISESLKNNSPALAAKEVKIAIAKYPQKLKEFASANIFYGEEGLMKGAINAAKNLYLPDKNNKFENYYLGYLYLKAGEYGKAEKIFRKANNKIMLGNIFFMKKKFELAIHYYEVALKESNFNLESMANMAALYEKTGSPLKSISLIKDINKFYDKVSVSYCLGNAYLHTEDYDKAEAELKKVLNLFPKYPIVHELLSRLYSKRGLVEKAYEELEIVYSLRSNFYIDLPELEMHLKKEIENDPENIKNYQKLGSLFMKKGNYFKALEIFLSGRKLLESKNNYNNFPDYKKINNNISTIYYGFGDEYLVSKDIEKAIFYFEKAKTIGYKKIEIYLKLGFSYEKTGMIDKAIEHYTMYLNDKMEDAEVYKALGNLYYNKKDYKNSGQQYMKCIKYTPKDADCHYNMGLTFFKLNRFFDAEREYKKAIAIFPEESDIHYNLALVFKEQGKLNMAEKEFKLAEKLHKR